MTETTTIILPTWAAAMIGVSLAVMALAVLTYAAKDPGSLLRRLLLGPDTWAVLLRRTGEKKINVIKAIRDRTGLGLKEAKEASERWPILVGVDLDRETAKTYRDELRAAGAEADILSMRDPQSRIFALTPDLRRGKR